MAPVTVGVALACRMALDPVLGQASPFMFFFVPILLSGWLGGLQAGLAAVLLSDLLVTYFYLPPIASLRLTRPQEAIQIVLFMILGALVSLLVSRLRLSLVRAEQARREALTNRQRMGGIVESAMDAIISIDETQRIVLFNTAAEQMFRCPAREALGSSLDRFIPERFRAVHREHVRAFGETAQTARAMGHLRPLSALRGDGEEFPIEASISQVEVEGHRIFTVILRDITGRMRGEERLRHSEQRYRSFVEASAQVVWTTNAVGEVAEPIPAWQAYTGQSFEDARGLGWMDAIEPADHARVTQAWRKAVAARDLYEVEYRLRRHDGQWRYTLARGVPVLNEDGAIREWIGTCIDITERTLAEERYRVMADSIPQLAWMARADGFIYWYNQRWYEYTGATPEQMEGWGWQRVHDPEVLPRVLERWQGSIATGQPFEMEFPLRGADGRFRRFLTRVRPLRGGDGQVMQWFGTNTDVTEQVEAAEELERRVAERTAQLRELNAKLLASNRELQDFAFVASHDLQEPLRKVMAFGDVLVSEFKDSLGETGADYLRRMHSAAIRMQALINDLLQFSRVTTKAQPFEPVNLGEVAAEVLSDLEIRLQQSGGRVEVDELPQIEADPMQMRQLLQNLLGNAIKFARPEAPPLVRIYSELSSADPAPDDDGQRVRLIVADNGIGFEEKYTDRIFTVFQRLHERGTYEGTGIGLAICRKIAERHGGSITARSQPGEGSTFIVTLPRHQNARRGAA